MCAIVMEVRFAKLFASFALPGFFNGHICYAHNCNDEVRNELLSTVVHVSESAPICLQRLACALSHDNFLEKTSLKRDSTSIWDSKKEGKKIQFIWIASEKA